MRARIRHRAAEGAGCANHKNWVEWPLRSGLSLPVSVLLCGLLTFQSLFFFDCGDDLGQSLVGGERILVVNFGFAE
jgi:hypothetical protein